MATVNGTINDGARLTDKEREKIRFARPSHVLPEHGLWEDTLDGCPDDCHYECGSGIDVPTHVVALCEKWVNVRYTVSLEAFHAQMIKKGIWNLCSDCADVVSTMVGAGGTPVGNEAESPGGRSGGMTCTQN